MDNEEVIITVITKLSIARGKTRTVSMSVETNNPSVENRLDQDSVFLVESILNVVAAALSAIGKEVAKGGGHTSQDVVDTLLSKYYQWKKQKLVWVKE